MQPTALAEDLWRLMSPDQHFQLPSVITSARFVSPPLPPPVASWLIVSPSIQLPLVKFLLLSLFIQPGTKNLLIPLPECFSLSLFLSPMPLPSFRLPPAPLGVRRTISTVFWLFLPLFSLVAPYFSPRCCQVALLKHG